jgi:hypothetical protein
MIEPRRSVRDIVQRLQQASAGVHPDRLDMVNVPISPRVLVDAVAEITLLRAEISRMRVTKTRMPKNKRKIA